MQKTLLEKLNKYDGKVIGLYCDFWGIEKIEFSFSAPEAKHFTERNKSAVDKGYTLVVTDAWRERDRNRVFISLSQLIYDLDVFYAIPAEIYNVIQKERFADFAGLSLRRMEQNGWEIGFTNSGYYTDTILSKYPVSFVSEDYRPENKRIFIINCWDEGFTKSYFDALKYDYYIETHRALALLREWLISEICFYFKEQLAERGVKLYLVNWEWAQNNYLYPKYDITAYEKEQRARRSIYNISGNEKQYETFLKELYGDDYSPEYVRGVMNIPLRNYYGAGTIRHSDFASEFLNVSLGERKTTDVPIEYDNNVYMLGGCVFFGYAIDDSKTISSYLQRLINQKCKKKVRVSNYAVWGGNIDETYNTFFELDYHRGDVVIISYAGKIPIGNDDISLGLASHNTDKEFYYEGVVHCNGEAYGEVANTVYALIENDLKLPSFYEESFRLKRDKNNYVQDLEYVEKTRQYLISVKEGLPPLFEKGKTYGCAVMNCNPFTLGHRFLVETASKQVDYFIIFVVEENKSYFPFSDRIELVKQGVADLKNVYVVPSGNLIISAVTFPGYFIKNSATESAADSAKDIEIFGRYIAPALGIDKRFVGTEPQDRVTNHYNDTMERILPQFGIDVVKVERTKAQNEVISASTVRKLLEEKHFEKLKRFVPDTTYRYLLGRFSENGDKK